MTVSFNIPHVTEPDGVPDRAAHKINTAFDTIVRSVTALQITLQERITDLDKRLTELEEKVTAIDQRVTDIEQRLG